jgi:hypothetical protein
MNHCKGCLTYICSSSTGGCGSISNNTNGTCPCSKCIVKSVCEEVCKPFHGWVTILDQETQQQGISKFRSYSIIKRLGG